MLSSNAMQLIGYSSFGMPLIPHVVSHALLLPIMFASLQIKLRVAPLTRAVAEGRLITKKPVFSDTEDEGGHSTACWVLCLYWLVCVGLVNWAKQRM